MALVLSIWRIPIFGDDFGLLFWGKNADCILKLLVREIKLFNHVETGRRLRGVRFDDVQFDVVDVVQTGPFPPLPESPCHVQGHAQGGFVQHSLLFAGWAAFSGTPRKRSYKFLRRITYICQFRARFRENPSKYNLRPQYVLEFVQFRRFRPAEPTNSPAA